jgi:hypothetical protein
MFGAIATIERNIMLERQRKGIAKAAAEGKYKSRKATARAKSADVLRLTASGGTREGDHGHVGDQPGPSSPKAIGGRDAGSYGGPTDARAGSGAALIAPKKRPPRGTASSCNALTSR